MVKVLESVHISDLVREVFTSPFHFQYTVNTPDLYATTGDQGARLQRQLDRRPRAAGDRQRIHREDHKRQHVKAQQKMP